MSVEIMIDDFLGRRVVWTIAVETVQSTETAVAEVSFVLFSRPVYDAFAAAVAASA